MIVGKALENTGYEYSILYRRGLNIYMEHGIILCGHQDVHLGILFCLYANNIYSVHLSRTCQRKHYSLDSRKDYLLKNHSFHRTSTNYIGHNFDPSLTTTRPSAVDEVKQCSLVEKTFTATGLACHLQE